MTQILFQQQIHQHWNEKCACQVTIQKFRYNACLSSFKGFFSHVDTIDVCVFPLIYEKRMKSNFSYDLRAGRSVFCTHPNLKRSLSAKVISGHRETKYWIERVVLKQPFALGSESGFQNPADSLPASFPLFSCGPREKRASASREKWSVICGQPTKVSSLKCLSFCMSKSQPLVWAAPGSSWPLRHLCCHLGLFVLLVLCSQSGML